MSAPTPRRAIVTRTALTHDLGRRSLVGRDLWCDGGAAGLEDLGLAGPAPVHGAAVGGGLKTVQLLRDDLQEIDLFTIWHERALESGHEDLLDALERPAVVLVAEPELLRHGRVGDDPIVGVD